MGGEGGSQLRAVVPGNVFGNVPGNVLKTFPGSVFWLLRVGLSSSVWAAELTPKTELDWGLNRSCAGSGPKITKKLHLYKHIFYNPVF